MVTQEIDSSLLKSASKDTLKTPAEFAERFRQKQQEYQRANARSAHAVLSFCKVVYDASIAFSADEEKLKEFQKHARLLKKSTFSQFRTIGATYDRLAACVEHLPASWYTLYLIATLPEQLFDAAVAANRIHSFATQQDVMSVANKLKPSRKTTTRNMDDELGILIGFDDSAQLTEERVAALWKALQELVREHFDGFSIGMTKALQEHLRKQPKPERGRSADAMSETGTQAHPEPIAA
jgi:hypothetical protein